MSDLHESVARDEHEIKESESYLCNLGPWTLNTSTNQLIQGERKVELEYRLTGLLVYLLQHRNQILTKSRIISALWQGKVVNDDSLAVAISQLRKALDDNPRTPKYIKTIPGVGYQFIWRPEQSITCSPSVNEGPEPTRYRRPPNHIPIKLFYGCTVFILCLISLLGWLLWESKSNVDTQGNASVLATGKYTDKQMLYRNAAALLARKDDESLRLAISLFRDVIAQYPDTAEAYLGIAEAKMKLLNEQITAQDNAEEIRALLNKALALDPGLARAHMWLGHLLFRHDYDLRSAEKHFKKSLELNPRDDLSHFLYEQLLLVERRFDEAREHIRLAREINPLTYPYTYLVWVYLLEKQSVLAVKELERIAHTELGDKFFHIAAQNVYYSLGQTDKVYEHMQWFFEKAAYGPEKLNKLNHAYQQGGLNAVYSWLLDNKEIADVGQYQPPLSWARYAVALGRKQEAMDYLEQAYQKRQFQLVCAMTDPLYDPLRDEPRFQALLGKFKPHSQLASR